jgi:peptidoglycan/xylan/chitin deacetylase (PgdA/CDA1 family)
VTGTTHEAALQPGRVFLTFDDGPDPEWTPRILDALAEAGVHATFFMIGLQALKYPALVRRIDEAGHATGNHTFSHRHPWLLSSDEARNEVRVGAKALEDILGHSPRFYRAPHGRHRACMDEEARRGGEAIVDWNLSAIDWGPLGNARGIATRLSRVRDGDIVLMHDGRNRHNRPDELIATLPAFLQELRRRSLSASPLDELHSH